MSGDNDNNESNEGEMESNEGEAQEPTNEKSKDDSEYVRLKVVGNDANEVHFKVKLATKMGKLKKSYSERMGIPVGSLRFLFDGKRIDDEESPKQLGMVDDDLIEVYQEQTGGASRA